MHGLNFLGGWVFWILALVILSMAFGSSVEAAPPSTFSRYHNPYLSVNLVKGVPVYLGETRWTEKIENVVVLKGETYQPVGRAEWIHLHGGCQFKRNPEEALVQLEGDGISYHLYNGDDTAFAVDATYPAAPMKISVVQNSSVAANSLRCSLTFEAVK